MLSMSRKTALGLIAAGAIVCATGPSAYASIAASSAPNPIVFNISITSPAGGGFAPGTVGHIPAGKYMVVQTVSYYRNGVVAGSIGQIGIISTLSGKTGVFYTLPCVADGPRSQPLPCPLFFTRGSGTAISLGAYRSGSEANDETDVVTVTGYLVDGLPNS